MGVPCLAEERLAEIASLEAFRPGFRDRLIALFRGAVGEQLPRCLQLDIGGTEERRGAAHALKGSAASIGALRLAAVAESLEQSAHDPEACARLSGSLRAEADVALAELHAWAGSMPSAAAP